MYCRQCPVMLLTNKLSNTLQRSQRLLSLRHQNMSVLDETNSQPLLMISQTINSQVEREDTLSLEKERVNEDITSVKAAEDKSVALTRSAHQDTGSPCQCMDHTLFKKQSEKMLSIKCGEHETPSLAETTDIVVIAAIDNVQSTPGLLSIESRSVSRQ